MRSMQGSGRRRVGAAFAAAAVTLAVGVGITHASATSIYRTADGEVVERKELKRTKPDAEKRDGIEVVGGKWFE